MEQLLNIENQMDTIRFVIADDNKINQYIIHFILKDRYINFHFAMNGEEAISVINEKLGKRTILLLDLNMPDMDGFEVLELLAKDPKKYGNVKTICISAMHLDNSTKEDSLKLCDYYLEKPVDKTQLLEKVASCISGN